MDVSDKELLREAIKAITALVEYDAADSITLEWKTGQVPKVTYVPNVPLEYVSISFTVVTDPEKQ